MLRVILFFIERKLLIPGDILNSTYRFYRESICTIRCLTAFDNMLHSPIGHKQPVVNSIRLFTFQRLNIGLSESISIFWMDSCDKNIPQITGKSFLIYLKYPVRFI